VARKKSSGGSGVIIHCVGVRNIVQGQGLLQQQLICKGTPVDVLAPIMMQNITDIEPWSHANFTNQTIAVYGYASNLDDDFVISRIVLFIKTVAENYPQ